MDDFDGFKTSVEKVTADVLEIARELELEVEPEDGTELLFHDKNFNKWGFTSYGWAVSESTPGEDLQRQQKFYCG